MFPVAPPSLSMVLKPWRNELRTRGRFFFAAYQAMLSVNQQTIAGAQQSAAKLALFSNPKTGSISCPKTGCAARGLLSLSWAARRLETCLKTFTHKRPVKFRQQMPANRPWWLTPFWGPNFGPQNGVRLSFFLSGFPFWGPKFEPQNGVSL